jgi:hypothetical protein
MLFCTTDFRGLHDQISIVPFLFSCEEKFYCILAPLHFSGKIQIYIVS